MRSQGWFFAAILTTSVTGRVCTGLAANGRSPAVLHLHHRGGSVSSTAHHGAFPFLPRRSPPSRERRSLVQDETKSPRVSLKKKPCFVLFLIVAPFLSAFLAWFSLPAVVSAAVSSLPTPSPTSSMMMNPELSNFISSTGTTVLVGFATSFVGWFYQILSARCEEKRTQRDLELSRAAKAAEDISSAADQLLYLQQHQIIHVVIRRSKNMIIKQLYNTEFTEQKEFSELDKQLWNEYNTAYKQFAASENWFLARAHCSFGIDSREELRRIYREFERCHACTLATYYFKTNGTGTDFFQRAIHPANWGETRRMGI
jgi:hypothetical protein